MRRGERRDLAIERPDSRQHTGHPSDEVCASSAERPSVFTAPRSSASRSEFHVAPSCSSTSSAQSWLTGDVLFARLRRFSEGLRAFARPLNALGRSHSPQTHPFDHASSVCTGVGKGIQHGTSLACSLRTTQRSTMLPVPSSQPSAAGRNPLSSELLLVHFEMPSCDNAIPCRQTGEINTRRRRSEPEGRAIPGTITGPE